MTTAEMQRTTLEPGTTTYRAAVVHDFAEPLRVEEVVPRHWSRARSECGSRPPACATPTSTLPTATGCVAVAPVRPGHEGVGIVEELGPGVTESSRRARRAAVARLRVQDVRLLRVRLGDACLEQKNMGYSIDGFGAALAAHMRDTSSVPDGVGPVRRGTDVRRRHDVQGNQGRRDALV